MMKEDDLKGKKKVFFRCFVSTFFLFIFAVYLCFSPGFLSAQEKDAEELNLIEENKVELSLKSVMVLALKNNLQIAFESLGPGISETEIDREKSVYDPNISLQLSKDRSVKQVGNVLSGAGEDSVWQQNWGLEADVKKKFVTGTSAELKWSGTDSTTDFLFQSLNPQYQSELNLSLTQPLLRDFGIDVGKSMIKIANLNFKISEEQFRKNVMDILYQIERYYWNLYFQIKDLEAREKSLKLAEDLLREFKIKIKAGTLAPVEIYQAEAEVAERKQDLIVARDLRMDTEDDLKSALNFYEKEQYWDLTIIPTDAPRPAVIKEELMESMKEAFEYRPDYNQAKMDIEARNIMVKYTKNQVLPRVDIFGTIGTMGLGGRTNTETMDFGGGGGGFFRNLFAEKPDLWSRHWDDVADSMASGDFYNYLIGLKIEFPLGNRFAKSQYSKAKIEVARAVTWLRDLENTIINEVREAVRQVETDTERVKAAKASLRFSQEKLKAEEKKYEVGLSTTHDLLEFQEDLARATSREALARADYMKNLADLARVKGMLLKKNNITVN
jgi:outer membrane protein TolC